MISIRQARRRTHAGLSAPKVGLFGLLGQGNLGNDGSLEAVLAYLKEKHPDAVLDFLCTGPEQITARYGIPASRLRWYRPEHHSDSGAIAVTLKSLGKVIDAFHTAYWVRRRDVVIVPGMGVLEGTTLPQGPWQTPYSMFLLCVSGRLFGTKVALVSVGANVIHRRLTRWFIIQAARRAHYRSYRDIISRNAMSEMGFDTSGDPVYPDLAFSLPTPTRERGAAGTVGVGVMDYSGGNDDLQQADKIHSHYVSKIKSFILWLLDNGRTVRVFTGDRHDERVAREILADVRGQRPQLSPSRLVAEPASSLEELMQQMATVETVVATRYHNVVCALKLAKPTLSVGYGAKFDAVMADMGLDEFCQPAKSLDVAQLIDQFTKLESRSVELRQTMMDRNVQNVRLLDQQFARISTILFPSGEPEGAASDRMPASKGAL